VKTTYGYHIIKVVSKKPGKPLKFEEVEAKVKNDLRTDLTQNYVGNLRKQAKVEVDEKAINKF
jgi:parvulin-like peptidyl-prolyl isomerase